MVLEGSFSAFADILLGTPAHLVSYNKLLIFVFIQFILKSVNLNIYGCAISKFCMHSVTNYLTGLFKFSIYELLIFLQGISPILALYGFYTLNVASDVSIGCLHVSVSDPDGYTLAGAVSGVLIAATSVRVSSGYFDI